MRDTERHVLYNCRQNLELSNSAVMTEQQVVKARKKSRACKRRGRERMLKFIERKKQEKTDKMTNQDSKSIKMSNCDQMKEDAKSLLNRSNERINKLEECNEQLRSYVKDLQVYCKELTKWTRESIESKSNENHELICDVNIMYDDVEYLTNLNKKLRAEVDHKKNIVRHLQCKLSTVKKICQARRLEF